MVMTPCFFLLEQGDGLGAVGCQVNAQLRAGHGYGQLKDRSDLGFIVYNQDS